MDIVNRYSLLFFLINCPIFIEMFFYFFIIVITGKPLKYFLR